MPKNSQTINQSARSGLSKIEDFIADKLDVDVAIQATFDEAGNSGLPGASGGPRDAYRHMLITAELVRRRGEALGPLLAKAHELKNAVEGTQTKADSEMDDHNNALAADIGKRAKTWDDVVRMARAKIEEAARHGGDGKDGRAIWNNKPQQPNWKPVWPKRPAAPNPKGGEKHRYDKNPDPGRNPIEGEIGGMPGKDDAGRQGRKPGNAGPRSDAPSLGDRPAPSAAALEAAEDAEAGAAAEPEPRAARAMMDRIANGRETVDELLNKPVPAVTRDEIDRLIASDGAMFRSHPDFQRANDFVTAWFGRVFGGLRGGEEHIAESRIAPVPIAAPAPDGGTVTDGAIRIGHEVLKDARTNGLGPAVAKLQDGLNSTIDLGRTLFRDGEFGPKTSERLRRAVARQGANRVLGAFRRAVPPERV